MENEPILARRRVNIEAQRMEKQQTRRLEDIINGSNSDTIVLLQQTSGVLEEEEADELPKQAFQQLLDHVNFDPDGGLVNLDCAGRRGYTESGQVSKVPALQKDNLEVALAMLVPVLCLVNFCGIFTPAYSDLYGTDLYSHARSDYFGSAAYAKDVELMVRPIHDKIPCMYDLILMMHILEFTGMAFILARFLWNLYHTIIPGARGSATGGRFVHVSNIFLRDIPLIQNFSILSAMTLIHPSLVRRFVFTFDIHERAARAVLEKFLRVEEDRVPDQDLVATCAKVLLRFKHTEDDGSDSQQQTTKATEYMYETPYGILQLLRNDADIDWGRLQAANKDLDTNVLFAWRFRAVVLCETILETGLIMLLLIVGVLGLFVKVCQMSIIFVAPDYGHSAMALSFSVFVNQIFGFLQVKSLLISRVETFAFGGSDAMMSDGERYVLKAYYTRLADTIWNTPALSAFEKLAVFLQFDDDDLQQLIIEEDAGHKSEVMLAVRRHRKRRAPLVAWVRDGYLDNSIFPCCRSPGRRVVTYDL